MIVLDNLSLVESGLSFKDIEEKIYKTVCDVGCKIIKEVLEHLDRRLMEERDSKLLRNKGLKHTCIKTIMGNLEFDRRIYEFKMDDGKKGFKFLLDEQLQMDTIGHYSSSLVDKVIDNICDLSFRKTAANIEKLSNQSISHTAVWNIVKKVGTTIENKDINKMNNYNQGKLNGAKECKVVFQEMDGLWISMQGKDRPQSGKSRKKEIKLGIIYEGWQKRPGSQKEYEVINKTTYTTFEGSKVFKALGEATLAEIYNVDEIHTRIINRDGAPWIRQSADAEAVYYQLDPFHRSQAIVRAVKDKSERKAVIKLFNEGKSTEGLEYITKLLIKYSNDKKAFKKLSDLYNYFVANKSGLVPYHLRKDLVIPQPPKGVEFRTLGTMEHNICDILAKRLKGRKRSWSNKGATNIAKILTEKANNRIGSIVETAYKNIVSDELAHRFEDIVVLHPEAVDRNLKKCKSYNMKKAAMPYDGCAMTEGRNTIRNLIRNRTMNNLGF